MYTTFMFAMIAVTPGLAFLLGFRVGFGAGQTGERQQAIEADAAKWITNEKTGEATFVYLSPSRPKEGS